MMCRYTATFQISRRQVLKSSKFVHLPSNCVSILVVIGVPAWDGDIQIDWINKRKTIYFRLVSDWLTPPPPQRKKKCSTEIYLREDEENKNKIEVVLGILLLRLAYFLFFFRHIGLRDIHLQIRCFHCR